MKFVAKVLMDRSIIFHLGDEPSELYVIDDPV